MPPAATPDPRLLLSTAWTEMGDHHPSPAPPCPQTPGPGLAAFRTSPSLDWVSPVAPAENTVLEHRSTFSFLLDFSSILPLNCTLGFYLLLSGPPHCDLTVVSTLVSAHCFLSPLNPYTTAHVPHLRPNCHSIRDSSAVPINHSTILYERLTRSVYSTTVYFPVHGCPLSFPFTILFARLFSFTVLFVSTFHFYLDFMNACYSALMPLTDTHSHHNLTTHILYPLCTLRDRIQISWLFTMHTAIMHTEHPKQKQKYIPSTGPLHSPPK